MYSKHKSPTIRMPWNKGKLMGQKSPLTPQEIWAIRIRLENEGRRRDLALFNLGASLARVDKYDGEILQIMENFKKELPESVRVIHLKKRSGQTFGRRSMNTGPTKAESAQKILAEVLKNRK